MAFYIPYRLKNIWDEWNLRIAVLVSLFFQIVLIFVAASRKRTGHRIITFFIWGAYLLADWVAAFAVGLISNGHGYGCDKSRVNDDLAAFWAPFLLLHLGGPDAITAFSLEDNELWLRHLLGLLIQLTAVAYVFSQSIPSDFWIPTVFLFCAGMIKYAERTRALYLACMANLKASIVKQQHQWKTVAERLIEDTETEMCSVNEGNLEPENIGDIEMGKRENNGDIEMVKRGYNFFEVFKWLIVDLRDGHDLRNSRKFFSERRCEDAFNIMEVELNFMYDVLYTKMAVVHCKIGYFFRFICSALIFLSFYLFASAHRKLQLHRFDLAVTYALLIGAVSLDFVAIFKLVFSDWTIALLENAEAKRIVSIIKRKTSFNQRWSNCVSRHSLINYCLKERFKWLDKPAEFFGLKEFIDEMQYKKHAFVKQELKEFIFDELRAKAREVKDSKTAKEICSAKGNWVLSQNHCEIPSIIESVSEGVEYNKSLLRWHIATALCYFVETQGTDQNGENESAETHREFCKLMSEYMLYLLVMRPTMMSAVAGIGQITFGFTCEEVRTLIARMKRDSPSFREFVPEISETEKVCDFLISTYRDCRRSKGILSSREYDRKSVLHDACRLAEDLMNMDIGRGKRWEIMSKVWVELLSYAASHCRVHAHAQELSKGGELITFVWLLMAHLGLGDQLMTGTEPQPEPEATHNFESYMFTRGQRDEPILPVEIRNHGSTGFITRQTGV